jgi:hypothetical protein
MTPLTQALVRDAMWNVVTAVEQVRNVELDLHPFLRGMVRADLANARTVMRALRETCPARYRAALQFARTTIPELRQRIALGKGQS